MMTRTAKFRTEVRTTLEDNILKFWLGLQDPAGGFFGQVRGDGTVVEDADRDVILYARLIWALSASWRNLRKKKYLLAATEAEEYFLKHFVDHRYGGVYRTVDKDGQRTDTQAQLFAQAAAIHALSEYYAAFRDEEALKIAVNLYQVVEKYFADDYGGYIEALTRDFQPVGDKRSDGGVNPDKTMASHLCLMEAYANLYRVWKDVPLKKKIIELLDTVTDTIMAPDGHLQLYFDRKWNVLPGGFSYGHDLRMSYVALESAMTVRDIDIVNKVKPLALKMGLAAIEGSQEDGSVLQERLQDGSFNPERLSWVQAEAVISNLWMWKFQNVPEAADRAIRTWDYINGHLIDHAQGGWYWGAHADGTPDTEHDKAGPGKDPYHGTRMCLQVMTLFDY